MAIHYQFAAVDEHGAGVQTFAQILEELRTDMLNKANALVSNDIYHGAAPGAFQEAFTQMSAASQNVIEKLSTYGAKIRMVNSEMFNLDQAEAATRFV